MLAGICGFYGSCNRLRLVGEEFHGLLAQECRKPIGEEYEVFPTCVAVAEYGEDSLHKECQTLGEACRIETIILVIEESGAAKSSSGSFDDHQQ